MVYIHQKKKNEKKIKNDLMDVFNVFRNIQTNNWKTFKGYISIIILWEVGLFARVRYLKNCFCKWLNCRCSNFQKLQFATNIFKHCVMIVLSIKRALLMQYHAVFWIRMFQSTNFLTRWIWIFLITLEYYSLNTMRKKNQ